jgi:hypothetical protein
VECSPHYFQHTLAVSAPASTALPVSASIIDGSSEPFDAPEWDGILQWISSTNDPGSGYEIDPWIVWGNSDNLATDECDCDPWFHLLVHAQNVTMDQLTDAATLINTTQLTFPGVWSDLAQPLLLVNPSSSVESVSGEVTVVTFQLVSRPRSVCIA